MRFSKQFIKADDRLCDLDRPVPAPYFRRSFQLDFVPDKAEMILGCPGFYELYLNGENITRCPLAPYIANPDHICYYDRYDIADRLQPGENVIGVVLGNGFRNAFGGFIWQFEKAPSRGPLCFALDFEACDAGQTLHFEADEEFVWHDSPILFNDLRMGYRYDARLELPGWCDRAFDASGWQKAVPAVPPKGKAKLCEAEKIAVTEKLRPVSVKRYDRLPYAYTSSGQDAEPLPETVRENVTVYDFGVNLAGITVLAVNGKPGQRITVRHGEHTVRGCYSENTEVFWDGLKWYLEYGQTDVFICKGGPEVFVPRFKYDGFRYAYVEGLEEEQATEEALTYWVMNGDFRERAGFSCSDEVLNRLYACCRNSDLANFLWFPTDCPHREKNGWTGDANMSAEHMLLRFDMKNSMKEWLCNIREAQREDGCIPGIVPTGTWGYEWGTGAPWDCVCIGLPYHIWQFDGDTDVIRDNADMMIRYLRYAEAGTNEQGLVCTGLGDWVDPYQVNGMPRTPVTVSNTALLHEYALKAALMMRAIGREEDAVYASAFAERLRTAFRAHLIDFSTMTVMPEHQTAQSVGIACGLFDEGEIPAAGASLLRIIAQDGNENTCGMVGRRYIYRVLSGLGHSDLAYRMIVSGHRTGYGSWIADGQTALREDFTDAKGRVNSLNHHFLGDFTAWMTEEPGGIHLNPSMHDLSEVEIAPRLIPSLDHTEAFTDTAFGRVATAWRKENAGYTLHVTLPAGMHGNLVLKDGFSLDGRTAVPLRQGENTFTVG